MRYGWAGAMLIAIAVMAIIAYLGMRQYGDPARVMIDREVAGGKP